MRPTEQSSSTTATTSKKSTLQSVTFATLITLGIILPGTAIHTNIANNSTCAQNTEWQHLNIPTKAISECLDSIDDIKAIYEYHEERSDRKQATAHLDDKCSPLLRIIENQHMTIISQQRTETPQ